MIPARIEMDEALAIVNSSLIMCVDILLDYMDEVNAAGVTAIRRPMRRRSFCSLLSDYFYSRMEQAAEHGSRFEHREDKGQHYIAFEDRLVVRVKQIDKRYLSWNLPTPHSLLWNRQLPAPGMEPLPRLELGYHLDALMIGYHGIHLLQRFDQVVDWRVQIFGARTDTYDVEQRRLDGTAGSHPVYRYQPVR